MNTIRTFFMRNTIDDGVIWSSTEELVEPSAFGELDEDSYIVFADIAEGKLHSLTIHNGIADGGLLTSHYSTMAWLVGRKVPVAIGTELIDLLDLPEDHPLKNTVYEYFFEKINSLLQNTTAANKAFYDAPQDTRAVLENIRDAIKAHEEQAENPEPVS